MAMEKIRMKQTTNNTVVLLHILYLDIYVLSNKVKITFTRNIILHNPA